MANRSNSPTVKLSRSTREGKKWMVNINGHVVHFGESAYQDFTQHNDEQRRANYIARHSKREHWHDPRTAGFWSRWLLWNKPTAEESKRDISKRFGISFV